jgi:prevent-host-death family protein
MTAAAEHLVGTRELRDHLSSVLRRVEAGEPITVTASGRPVAQIVPLRAGRWTPRSEVEQILATSLADAGLSRDLDELAGDELDDLP